MLAFDATYGRNKCNISMIVLSRVNHHNQTCVFGTAMVSCEYQDSYKWVLNNFLDCMRGKAPKWEAMINEYGVKEVEWDRVVWSSMCSYGCDFGWVGHGALPHSLLLGRWCKGAKSHMPKNRVVSDTGYATSQYHRRVGVFVDQCKRLAKVAYLREEDFKAFLEKMLTDTALLEVRMGCGWGRVQILSHKL
ncbi:hypothetical protein AHAS_Ahas04G0164000 [Arachis hypogaea]